ncbi:FAD assembly factor SdhE [Brevundimonas sp.]|uniref:FAD assembly factor SdhE n=1 Tax=Brevundimonas sp. TaxID=1871086 RepID=UPI002FCB208E
MADIDARPEDTAARERLGRILFRAWRRGFREADLVLGPFAEQVGPTLTDDELNSLEALLAEDDDHRLYAWIIGSEPTPPAHDTAVMGKIRDFMRDHVAAAVAEGAG